uniref:Cytochrome b6-f complex subunit PetP n=1 Tax=Ophidocladus simpliciusculus TaxID=1261574 RepID=A0A1Z1MJK3_9FLOR|nr:cytochrome b6-f complex subunit PetP [Ophidocladus simpliciusculus]ARW66022.1 cytochrome b6-f complex subunit PetP [Ophidocladus simpliciusculus]
MLIKPSSVNIIKAPLKIKAKIVQYMYKKLNFIGYKKLSNKHKIPILQLPDKKRIWMLKSEIKYTIK